MSFCWTAMFVASLLAGTQGLNLPESEAPTIILPGEQFDDVSDSSSDIILSSPNQPQEPEAAYMTDVDDLGLRDANYGMNIGLHYVLEDIIRRMTMRSRVHLESLIKVLVLLHNIEKVGGTINDSNGLALKRAAVLYPKPLREAMALSTTHDDSPR